MAHVHALFSFRSDVLGILFGFLRSFLLFRGFGCHLLAFSVALLFLAHNVRSSDASRTFQPDNQAYTVRLAH